MNAALEIRPQGSSHFVASLIDLLDRVEHRRVLGDAVDSPDSSAPVPADVRALVGAQR